MIADTTILATRDQMLPTKAPPAKVSKGKTKRVETTVTSAIENKNLFSGTGKVAPPFGQEPTKTDKVAPTTRDPIQTRLPITLAGTIVSSNEDRSIATVNIRSKNEILPIKKGEVIDRVGGKSIEIIKIERGKVIFRVTSSGSLEFVQLKRDEKINFGVAKKAATPKNDSEVVADGESDFRISQDVIKKYTANLTDLLQQARAVPNIVPGSGGEVDGYRIVDIRKDSIFSKLGIKRMDVIKGVNGESIDSPAKAMQMYNALKNSKEISLEVEREGGVQTFNYTIE